ncbi:DUF5713 family protein [Flavobacterium gelatinilyticum]|mgnify:CR=1 FL=1|uniref:DUF5713 family protein n=1 Tax=Flavobacterium gelatinilyticum TaxID=3003260 RepID=UPI002480094A|nr:DUF5713 family protein [Flavobacterium gelatinilyticum]
MKNIIILLVSLVFTSCLNKNHSSDGEVIAVKQNDLKNEKIRNYRILEEMYNDSYFPPQSVDKVRDVLLEFCFNIEKRKPKNLDQLYELSHTATEKINNLQDDFYRNGSELETGARESIAMDFDFICKSYGFKADVEELISNRDW